MINVVGVRKQMKILKSILDAFFPPDFTCDLCGREIFDGGHFCKACADTVILNDGTVCPVCGRKTDIPELCFECKAAAPVFDKAVSALVYKGGGRDLILAFKKTKPYLKDYFAELLAVKCSVFGDADAVCFVPMIKRDERKRGYNQSYLIAKELAKNLNLPLLRKALEKVKRTSEQKTLGKNEREKNLKSVFKANGEVVKGKIIIIVDDVMTTGATANALSAELKKKGASKVYFATVASVEYAAQQENNAEQ